MAETVSRKMPVWLWVIIIICIILIIVAAIVASVSKKPKAPTPTKGPAAKPGKEFVVKKPKIIRHGYIGEITSLKPGEIKILANARSNGLKKDTPITVKVDEKTRYSRRTIPKVLPKEADTSKLFKREAIKFEDLKVGDRISASTQEDISGKTEFTATTINVLQVK